MRNITISCYKFNELPKNVKETACNIYQGITTINTNVFEIMAARQKIEWENKYGIRCSRIYYYLDQGHGEYALYDPAFINKEMFLKKMGCNTNGNMTKQIINNEIELNITCNKYNENEIIPNIVDGIDINYEFKKIWYNMWCLLCELDNKMRSYTSVSKILKNFEFDECGFIIHKCDECNYHFLVKDIPNVRCPRCDAEQIMLY